MLRKFKISIDGKEYLVEMEEVGSPTPTPVAVTPIPAVETPVETIAQSAPEPSPVRSTLPVVGADAMPAPMPGTILKVLVAVGDSVTENQPLMILEAMKMENEIVASSSGTVSAIHVNEGQTVNAGDGLITLA